MLLILINTPIKRDFPKISENGHSEKYFDFASGFLLSKNDSTDKKQWCKASLSRYIIHLMTKVRNFRHSLWSYDISRWIKAKKNFENPKLIKVNFSYQTRPFWLIVYIQLNHGFLTMSPSNSRKVPPSSQADLVIPQQPYKIR